MISLQAIKELRAEARRLREQASHIEAFLGGLSHAGGYKSSSEPDIVAEAHPLTNGTFASQVRQALRAIGTATSREVSARLVEQGLPEMKNGKPLKDTISVELFRMSRKGTGGVRKVSRGHYRIDGL